MQVVSVEAKPRELGKKKGTKALRKENLVPAVLYGGDNVHHIAVEPGAVRSLVYTHEFKTVDLNIDGDVQKCILKDIQFHPVTDEIVHMDFLKIIDGHPIKVNIPLHFKGTPVGVANGGRLVKELRKIDIKVLPSNLVDHLVVDISGMNMGDSLRVKDIETEEGVEILQDKSIPVALVQTPRALLKAGGAANEEGEENEEAEETAAEA